MDFSHPSYAFDDSLNNDGGDVITVKTIVIPNIWGRDMPVESGLERRKRRWVMALTASGAIGSVTGLVGIVLAAVSLLNVVMHEGRASLIGSLLLVTTFLLGIFAAHCLDKIEETNGAIWEANRIVEEKDK